MWFGMQIEIEIRYSYLICREKSAAEKRVEF